MYKKNIALFISNFRRGGAETQFWNLVDGLNREKFVVHVIQFEHHDQKADFLDLPETKVKTVQARFTFDPTTIWELRKYIKDNQICLIKSMQFMDNQFAGVIGILTGIPVVTGVRGELLPVFGHVKTFFEYGMQRLVTKVVTNSNWLKAKLVNSGWKANKIQVIYNGIDTLKLDCSCGGSSIRKQLEISDDTRVVGIVGRLHPMKDHGTYVEALNILAQKNKNIIGLIIGCGIEEDNIRELITNYGLQKRVIFAGEIVSNIGCWFKSMDILLLTSQWGESFPNVIIEGMACKVPIVATDVSAVREIITDGENGFVVPIKDAYELAKKARILLEDQSLSRCFTDAAMKTVDNLSKEKMVSKFENLFESLITDTANIKKC